MSGLDPVQVVREAVTAATGAPTTRVLDVDFASGPMPLVHVALLDVVGDYVDTVATVTVDVYALTPTGPAEQGATGIATALRRALHDEPLSTAAGFVDGAVVTQCTGARPYLEDVETVSIVLDVTYRQL